MLAQKQPPLKECVIAHWSRGSAPKMTGAQVQNRSCVNVPGTLGRGAFHIRRRYTVRSAGEYGSENAGMSSEKNSENLFHRKPKVS